MKRTLLRNYARLIARTGGAVKKKDTVIIQAALDQPEFITMLCDECYKAGAERVIVEWSHQPVKKLGIRHMKAETLGRVECYEEAMLKYRLEKNPVMIYILSEDPNGLKGINQSKYSQAIQSRYKVIKPYRDEMDNKYKWCIAAAPGKEWAKTVYPEERTSTAIEKLWRAILYTSRVIDKEGNRLDPIEEWNKHSESFKKRCKILNEAGLTALHYKASNGTDLTVGLMKNGNFLGGGEHTLSGEYFNPNIPTEEIFTTPFAGKAEGIVYSSMPLSYRGEIIDGFSITFRDGKAVDCSAEKNEKLLREMISMDEGASMLGECAFVPYDSPINQSGIMFYETLFDENAACHLALGEGFTNTVTDYFRYSKKELHGMGVNDSSIHVDFMIGTNDLSITGIKENGENFPIFIDGGWAF
ncbi:MAG: aminopeptidase [Clostridia bacterium]|nr:aminopeptidase [Clostridia bacterium]